MKTDRIEKNFEYSGLSGERRMRDFRMRNYRMRLFLSAAATILISAVGFIVLGIPYSSPTDTLLTMALGGCDGFGAPQFLCSFHMNTVFSFVLHLIRRVTGIFNIFGLTLILLFTLAFCLLQIEASDRDPAAHIMIAVIQILCLRYFTYTVVAYISVSAGILCRASLDRKHVLTTGRLSPEAGKAGPEDVKPGPGAGKAEPGTGKAEPGTGKQGLGVKRTTTTLLVCSYWIIMLSGASLRYDVVITALAILLPTLIYDLMLKYAVAESPANTTSKLPRKPALAPGLPAMFAAAVILWVTVSMVINPLMFKAQGAEWSNYYDYDKQSLRIRDGHAISYDDYRDVMDEVGWSQNDLSMAQSWMFSDLEVFGTQNLKEVADAVKLTDKLDLDLPDLSVKFFGTPMAVGYLFICCIAIGIAIRRASRYRDSEDNSANTIIKWHLLILLLAALLPCLLWGALYVRQRFVDRVAVPFLAIGILQFTELLKLYVHTVERISAEQERADADTAGLRGLANKRIAVTAITLLFCVVAAGKIRTASWESADQSERLTFRQYLEDHSDDVFLTVSGVLNRMTNGLPAVAVSPDAEYANTIRLGSQLSFSGIYYDRCRRLGIPDPDHLMKNLIINENDHNLSGRQVLLLASRKADAEKIRVFLAEHYEFSGGYTKLAEIMPGVIVYRFQ